MPSSLPADPESWADLLRRNGWHTVSIGKISHEPDGFRWNYPSNYDIGRSSAMFADMRFSWDEILFGHDKWGAQRYPLFAYADGTGRVRGVSPAWEIGIDENGQSLPDEAYPDGQMAQAAIEKLREFADDGTRFCLAVGFFKPHLPFNAPKAYWDLYDPSDQPKSSFAWENLEDFGLGKGEPVFRFTVASDRDNFFLWPSTSTNMHDWSFEPLEFVDATDLGNSMTEVRFRSTDRDAVRRFFRFGQEP